MRRGGPRLSGPSLESLRHLLHPLVSRLSAMGVSPDLVTLLGWALSMFSAVLFAAGEVRLAAVVMLAGGLFDALDGAIARQTNRTSDFGAFLDSTLDRLSESAILVGLVFFFAASGRPVGALVAGAAMTFSLLTSYSRARAEVLGYECNVGVMGRAGRVAILGFGSLAGAPLAAAAIVATGAAVTSFQRVLHVRGLYLADREKRR